MFGPVLPVFLTDRPEIAATDLNALFQEAIRAFTRLDGNAILRTMGDKPGKPDRLVFIAEGKAATESFKLITELMDKWDK